jgi:transposase-like protein/predicted GIY-YIG superfamily endonuclease
MPFRKFSDDQVREMYEYAAQNNISILQACRNRGLSKNDYGIMRNWGKKLGLKCLTSAEMTGHSERDSQLYVLIVHGTKTGIYIGSSADPNLRFKQHIIKARRDGATGVNKRDRFMFEAMQDREYCFSFKVFPKKYRASQIAPFETALIAKMQKAFPEFVLLNGLVGAPMGGYGLKLSKGQEQAIIDDYTSNRITTQDLAEKYGVGRGTINRILQRAGATKPRAEMMVRYNDDVRQAALADLKAGATYLEICEKYGMSSSTAYKLKMEFGLVEKKAAPITNITVHGTVFPTLKQAADQYGVKYTTVHRRIKKLGWSVEQALEIEPRITPYTKKLKAVTAFGVEYRSMTHAARAFGMNPKLVASRARNCWPVEEALTIEPGGAPLKNQWRDRPTTQQRREEVKALGFSSLAEAAKAHGLKTAALNQRLNRGFSVKDALETPRMNRWSNRA